MVGHPKKNKSAYQQRYAVRYIHKDSPPILIIHGWKDVQVGIHQAYDLEEKLKRKSVEYQMFYQLKEGHVPRPKVMKETLGKILEWMKIIEENQKIKPLP